MNTTKVLMAGVVLAIAAYFVVGNMKGGLAPDNPREEWFSKLDANKDGELAPEELKAIDANNDGKISLDEAKAYGISETAANNMDSNKDGFISQDEMKTYRNPRHQNA
jgi:Ca2+-binding EF-hand superfamily protein